MKFDINNPTLPIWQKQIDTASPANGFSSIKELKNGDLLIVGGLDTNLMHNLNWNTLHRIIKMDKNANIIWKKYYNYQTNAPADNQQGILGLEITNDNSFITAIQVNNTNPNPFFVVKYDSTGCDSSAFYCSTVGIDELKIKNEELKIYPNPTNGIITIETANSSNILLKLTNVLGQLIKEETLKFEKQNINLVDLRNGIYFLQVYDNEKLIGTRKIVKE